MNDILLITIDSIRADRIQGNRDHPTPNISNVAENGISCEQAYANGIPTYFSFKSILGGIQALSCDRGIGLPTEVRSISEVLSRSGFTTGGFNAANPWLTANSGYKRGFDHFEDFLSEKDKTSRTDAMSILRNVQGRMKDGSVLRNSFGFCSRLFCTYANINPITSGETLVDSALDWLEAHTDEESVFMWVHFMDPHYPWIPKSDQDTAIYDGLSNYDIASLWHKVATSNYSSEEFDQLTQTANSLYDADVQYVDSQVGRLLEQFARIRGGKPHSVIAGDHGTELGDHGGFSHGPDTLYQEIIHVPLIISSPDVDSDTITNPVGLVDIPPTITDLASVDAVDFEGESIFDSQRENLVTEVIYDAKPASGENMDNNSLLAVVEYPWKLIFNEQTDSIELYNLEEDPDETANCAEQEKETVSYLRSIIEQHQTERQENSRTHEEVHRIRQFVEATHL